MSHSPSPLFDPEFLRRLDPAQLYVVLQHLSGKREAEPLGHADAHYDHVDSEAPEHADSRHMDAGHADHCDAHSDVHADRTIGRAGAEVKARIDPLVLYAYGIEPKTIETLSVTQLHELTHRLGISPTVQALAGFPEHAPLTPSGNHLDDHNDKTDHVDSHDDLRGTHIDHTDAHYDLPYWDTGGKEHGDHNDGGRHADSRRPHEDVGQHGDSPHQDHVDANNPRHADTPVPHWDHGDGAKPYIDHCDYHLDHWDHTDGPDIGPLTMAARKRKGKRTV